MGLAKPVKKVDLLTSGKAFKLFLPKIRHLVIKPTITQATQNEGHRHHREVVEDKEGIIKSRSNRSKKKNPKMKSITPIRSATHLTAKPHLKIFSPHGRNLLRI